MAVRTVGLDTAKSVFQVHGADEGGRGVLPKRLRRAQVAGCFANLPTCVVGLEATQGAHYWARVIASYGHQVRLSALGCVPRQRQNRQPQPVG
jgi:transposase